MKDIIIDINKELSIIITGKYIPAEEEWGLRHSFEIKDIKINKGKILNLIEWANSFKQGDVFEILEDKVLEKF